MTDRRASPPGVYLAVYASLLAGTAATVGAAFLPLGSFAPAAALGIASGKAALVVLWFMHVRESPRAAWVLAGAGLAWLLVLLVPVLVDTLARGWVHRPSPW